MIQERNVEITFTLARMEQALKVDKVKPVDRVQYALCAETWCRIVRSCVSEPVALDLHRAINQFGLYSCIADADAYAKAYLAASGRYNATDSGLSRLWQIVVGNARIDWYIANGYSLSFPHGSVESGCYACEVILRFPKRFTSAKPDTTAALAKFKTVHKDVRVFTHCSWKQPGPVVIGEVRAKMREILIPRSKRAIQQAIKAYNQDWGSFSGGSAYYPSYNPPTSPVAALKYGWALKVDGDGYYNGNRSLPLCTYPNGTLFHPDKYAALIMAVPKDYETSRIIAPETPTLNREASRVRRLLLSLTAATGALDSMPPEDQSLNRERARIGSTVAGYAVDIPWDSDKWIATIDLSHASDSISRDLFFSLLPTELHSIIRCALSDRLTMDGTDPWTGKPGKETCTPYLLATSGSVLTPILQSCFYLAICRYACDLVGRPYTDVTVYNDDITCTECIFETVCELLAAFGLTVNEKKTFHGTNPFRESCGGEYVFGVDVTGLYWPRKAIRIDKDEAGNYVTDPNSLATLIALQHKLYQFVYVRDLLNAMITSLDKRVTYSPVDAESDDLWADFMGDKLSMESSHYSQRINWNSPNTSTWSSEMKTLYSVGATVHEHIAYYHFLERGPAYDDYLDEVLHTSTREDSWLHSREIGELKFVVRKPVIR